MFWFSEFSGPSSHPFEQRGTIELNVDHVATRQPVLKVLLKLFASLLMFCIGLGIVVPALPLPRVAAFLSASLALLFYCAIAHYVRPRPNFDNMGWVGGFMDDPCQLNDDINRGLWSMSCWLGPGRFVSASLIDTFVTIGLLPERTQEDIDLDRDERAEAERQDRAEKILSRVEALQSTKPQGVVRAISER